MQDQDYVAKEDDLIAVVVAKSRVERRANGMKKETRKKKKMSCIFKRKAPKSKNRSGFVDVSNVQSKEEEARKTWKKFTTIKKERK